MERKKIGKGYTRDSYGRRTMPNVIIWLINGKAYAKDASYTPYQTDLPGYVMVNHIKTYNTFHSVGLISEHNEFNPDKPLNDKITKAKSKAEAQKAVIESLEKKSREKVSVKELADMLRGQTQSLKIQFIKKSAEYAKVEYDRQVKMANWKEVDWCKYYGLEPRMVNEGRPGEFLSFPKGFFNTKKSVTYDRERSKAVQIKRMGKDEFIQKAKESAKDHYENSIEKLAYRIDKKGLDKSNISMHSTRVKENIETTITDGKKTVNAWTIVAFGPVQKPHYRYLIK
jgi:hypothetical protein